MAAKKNTPAPVEAAPVEAPVAPVEVKVEPPKGKRNLTRESIEELVGTDIADRMIPKA